MYNIGKRDDIKIKVDKILSIFFMLKLFYKTIKIFVMDIFKIMINLIYFIIGVKIVNYYADMKL